MKNLEHKLQVACVKWFDLQYPEIKKLLWATPNGGYRNAIEAMRLKAEGVRRGVPDLFLAYPSNGYSGLFIEMKIGKNKKTIDQDQYFHMLTAVGYLCKEVRSFDEFVDLIVNYFKKM